MSTIPNPMKKVASIVTRLSPSKMIAAGVTNTQVCNGRTVRFDLPEGKAKDGINRVKVTDIDGTYRVQFLRVEEVDVVGGVTPDRLTEVISKFTGVDL